MILPGKYHGRGKDIVAGRSALADVSVEDIDTSFPGIIFPVLRAVRSHCQDRWLNKHIVELSELLLEMVFGYMEISN